MWGWLINRFSFLFSRFTMLIVKLDRQLLKKINHFGFSFRKQNSVESQRHKYACAQKMSRTNRTWAEIKIPGHNAYMLRWSYKTIWIYFNLILHSFLKILLLKCKKCNLIGWNSVYIFDICNCYHANINGIWNAEKLGWI